MGQPRGGSCGAIQETWRLPFFIHVSFLLRVPSLSRQPLLHEILMATLPAVLGNSGEIGKLAYSFLPYPSPE